MEKQVDPSLPRYTLCGKLTSVRVWFEIVQVELHKWRRRGFVNEMEVAIKVSSSMSFSPLSSPIYIVDTQVFHTQTMHGEKIQSKDDLESIVKEITNLSALSHPKVVQFFGILWPAGTFPGIVSYQLFPHSLLIGCSHIVSFATAGHGIRSKRHA